jgi:hypothetical protein
MGKKPDKYSVDNYSFFNVDNLDNCKEDMKQCPKCGNPSHVHWHVNNEVQTETDIQIKTAHMHGHFACVLNSRVPALDEGRNIFCYTKDTMVNKRKYCELKWKMKKKKNIPEWLRRRLNGDEY